ncbi:MAG TPA: hypothetical protein VGG15_10090 [Terriglobales bacterium]
MLLFRLLAAFLAANFTNSNFAVPADVPDELSGHEYTRRLRERERELAKLSARYRRLWVAFVATLSTGIAAAAFSLWRHLSPIWVLPLGVALVVLFRSLSETASAHIRIERIISFYERGLARLSQQWQGRGDGGEEFLPSQHPYARDLDLFGEGSLFEFLCTARTGVGRATLASWLHSPADPRDIELRQQAVAELGNKLALQEEWSAAGNSALRHTEAHIVKEWANAPNTVFPLHLVWFARMLPVIVLLAAGCALFCIPFAHLPLLTAVLLALEAATSFRLLKSVRQITADVGLPSFELGLMAPLLELVQAQNFECSLLTCLQGRLADARGPAGSQIRHFRFWSRLLELRQSEYFAAAVSPLLWGTNLAIVIERWRYRHREALSGWLESLGCFEALLCLARYHYENPGYTFPIVRIGSPALFTAESMGHPLLERKSCVLCDVVLDASACEVMMVSGSNMSGKSTLLRSAGVNAVLAFAGAPVRACRLELSSMTIGCSISVHDSLVQGRSRFAAEVERLKAIISTSRDGNTLFLLDEILGGTNSQDRLRGTEAILKQVVRSGAIGFITTHDLALTDLVTHYSGRVINVHFAERYENGEMLFDYKMRPGVLTHTNGMNVIAALGLSDLLR